MVVCSDYTKQHNFYNSRSVKPYCITRLLKNVTPVRVRKFLEHFERSWTISRLPGSLYSNVRDRSTWNQSEPNQSALNQSTHNFTFTTSSFLLSVSFSYDSLSTSGLSVASSSSACPIAFVVHPLCPPRTRFFLARLLIIDADCTQHATARENQ